jgi:hypothetical protein
MEGVEGAWASFTVEYSMDAALHDTAWFMIRLSDYFVFIYIPVS